MPKSSELQLARLPGETASIDASIIGTYEYDDFRFDVSWSGKELVLRVCSSISNMCIHNSILMPARNGVYFLAEKWRHIRYLQVVNSQNNGSGFLWDNQGLINKVPVAVSAAAIGA
jgi:hypothetical protein